MAIHTRDVVQGALSKAIGQRSRATLKPEETQYLDGLDQKIRARLLTEAQKSLIRQYALDSAHHNDRVIYLSGSPHQKSYLTAENARYWYRAMAESEFNQLHRTGTLPQGADFQGIAPFRDYSKDYMTNTSPLSHVVEFDLRSEGFLFRAMRDGKINTKAEAGGSFGLGRTGTKPPSGRHHASLLSALAIFHAYLKEFRLVDLRILNALTSMR